MCYVWKDQVFYKLFSLKLFSLFNNGLQNLVSFTIFKNFIFELENKIKPYP